VGGGPGQGGILDDIFDRPLVFVACNIMVDEIFDEAYATSAQTEGAGEVIARQVLYCGTHDSQIHFAPAAHINLAEWPRMSGASMAVSVLAGVLHPKWRVLGPMWCRSCQLSTKLPPDRASIINKPTCDHQTAESGQKQNRLRRSAKKHGAALY
jgi:hypothetical protein